MDFYLLLALLAAAVTALEAWWRARSGRPIDQTEAGDSVAIGLAGYGAGLAAQLLFALSAAGLAERVAPWHFSARNPTTWVVFFVADDLVNYLVHRAAHKVPVLWAAHCVHHSATDMNFTAAVRISPAESFARPVIALWAPLVGFPLGIFTPFLALSLLKGLAEHTETIGRHPWLDRLFATPSSHRVHHGLNPVYIDKNFGSTLMIWDHLFRTYQAETEAVRFGSTTPLQPGLRGQLSGGFTYWAANRPRRSWVPN
jgi:sterol desaturase/sphingolipid hydroxylase (fatty acid hydroxylase superfamily)